MIGNGTFLNISGVAIAIAKEHGFSKDLEVRTRFLEKLDKIMDDAGPDRKSTRLNSSHIQKSRMPSSA